MPRITVPQDNPLARATAVTPPKPMASASAAATKRRVRSSKTRERTSNLYAKPPASGIAASIEHFRSKCSIYFVTAPYRKRRWQKPKPQGLRNEILIPGTARNHPSRQLHLDENGNPREEELDHEKSTCVSRDAFPGW